ncbi:MAG: M56 family metallopeptidase [Bacteroidota bacterium]
MIVYFIKVVAFQLLFLLGYDLFLKKETFFNWNRIYLIFSSLISFVLPFIKIESFQNVVPQEYIILLPEIVLTPEKAVAPIEPTWNWFLIIGIAVSSMLFIYKIVQLLRLRFKGRFVKREHYTLIIIPKSTVAFSIFNYVFIGEQIDEPKLEDILSHELVHIREKHSLDLLYFEILRILCWFNPLVYIYQKRISEVHEYIADAAIVQHKNKSDYYEKLLAEVFQTQQFSFTNQFFKHSLIKKRIIMLTKKKSRKIFKLKYLVLIPMLVLSLLYTSCEDTTVAENVIDTETVDKEVLEKQFENLVLQLNTLTESVPEDKEMTKDQFEQEKGLRNKIIKVYNHLENAQIVNQSTYDEPKTYEEYLIQYKEQIAQQSENEVFQQEEIPFSKIDKAPIYPGCDANGSLEEIKECFTQSFQKHVNLNFDTKRAEALKLKGIQRIYARFVIDTDGNVTDINVRAPHPGLVDETERVLLTVPKMIPAEKNEKPVRVKYVLPIAFKVFE